MPKDKTQWHAAGRGHRERRYEGGWWGSISEIAPGDWNTVVTHESHQHGKDSLYFEGPRAYNQLEAEQWCDGQYYNVVATLPIPQQHNA